MFTCFIVVPKCEEDSNVMQLASAFDLDKFLERQHPTFIHLFSNNFLNKGN